MLRGPQLDSPSPWVPYKIQYAHAQASMLGLQAHCWGPRSLRCGPCWTALLPRAIAMCCLSCSSLCPPGSLSEELLHLNVCLWMVIDEV